VICPTSEDDARSLTPSIANSVMSVLFGRNIR
jgi:hypothetical protein